MKLLRLGSNASEQNNRKKHAKRSGYRQDKNCSVKEKVNENPPGLEEIYEKYERGVEKEKPRKKRQI